MIPILYDQNETEFLTNGLGRLSDAISCYTEETRNGEYALSMVYPLEGIHFADISIGRLILASVGNGQQTQPFRISEIKRTLDGKKAEIYAPHISYDLNKMVALPFSASSAAGAFAALESAIQGNTHFTFSTDKTVDSAYALTKPMSVRAVLGGTEGSFTDVYGQIEYQFDRFKVVGNLNRGADRGVTIRYGKNLTKLENSDIEDSVYTAIIPYVTYRDASSAEKSIVGDMIKTDAFDSALPKIKSIDLSSKWTDTENEPTAEQVTDLGKAYLEQEKDLSEISKSIKVSYIDLSKTEEYKGRAILEEVRLCDTVHVRFDALGVNATAKAVKIKYNVLLDRVEEVELGSAANNLSSTLKSAITQATADLPTTSDMEAAQRHAAELITGGLGGVIYVRRNANGQPIEIDICSALADGSLPASYKEATNGIWRWNANGLAYFDKYTDDPYTADTPIAITADGAINASLITTGELMAGLIKTGIIKAKNGLSYWDLDKAIFANKSNNGAEVLLSNGCVNLALGSTTNSSTFVGSIRGQVGTSDESKMSVGINAIPGSEGVQLGVYQSDESRASYYALRVKKNETSSYARRVDIDNNSVLRPFDVRTEGSFYIVDVDSSDNESVYGELWNATNGDKLFTIEAEWASGGWVLAHSNAGDKSTYYDIKYLKSDDKIHFYRECVFENGYDVDIPFMTAAGREAKIHVSNGIITGWDYTS